MTKHRRKKDLLLQQNIIDQIEDSLRLTNVIVKPFLQGMAGLMGTVDYEEWESALKKQKEAITSLRILRAEILEYAVDYGQIDGEHHKQWALDQIARLVAGDDYNQIIKDYMNGEDGPETYKYNKGIAP